MTREHLKGEMPVTVLVREWPYSTHGSWELQVVGLLAVQPEDIADEELCSFSGSRELGKGHEVYCF